MIGYQGWSRVPFYNTKRNETKAAPGRVVGSARLHSKSERACAQQRGGVCVCASTWSGYWLVRCWWLRATEASFVVGCSAGLAPPEQPAPHAFLRLVPSWSELILPPFSPISLWVTRKIFRSGVFAATDFQGIWYVFVFESWGLLRIRAGRRCRR
jgi:hypothetical protein